MLLNQVDSFETSQATVTMALPFAVEACWNTGKWDQLKAYLEKSSEHISSDFNVGVATALTALYEEQDNRFLEILQTLRSDTARSLSKSNTMSLQACHDIMLRLHALSEIELLSGANIDQMPDRSSLMSSLTQRLDMIGAFLSDKQYLLGLRRAVMQLSR